MNKTFDKNLIVGKFFLIFVLAKAFGNGIRIIVFQTTTNISRNCRSENGKNLSIYIQSMVNQERLNGTDLKVKHSFINSIHSQTVELVIFCLHPDG